MHFQGIQPENGLKAQVNKVDETDLTLSTAKNAVKKTLRKRFAILLEFEYFSQPLSSYNLHEKFLLGSN